MPPPRMMSSRLAAKRRPEACATVRRRLLNGVLGLRHMARIDGFRTEDGTVVVTDVNGARCEVEADCAGNVDGACHASRPR